MISNQQIILASDVEDVTKFMICATQKSPLASLNIVLRALGAVLYENGPRLEKVTVSFYVFRDSQF